MRDVIIQGIGILGMVFAILSFQCKSNKIFFVMQGLSGASFSLHFFLLCNPTAGYINMINILRGYTFGYTKGRLRNLLTLAVTLLYTVSSLLTYDSWVSVLLMVVQISATAVMWTDNPHAIRYLQVFFVSPSWLYQNVLTGSIGGVICECFNMVSVLISFFRFGFRGQKRSS